MEQGPIVVEQILRFELQSRRLDVIVSFVRSSQGGLVGLHLVPVEPTRTSAHSGEKPDSRGSNNEEHAAITSSRVSKRFCENG